jgi:DNA-binding transcriptional LysR family regulator
MLAEFVLSYPAVTLEVDLSSRFVDLIAENFDVAVRMGELRFPGRRLMAAHTRAFVDALVAKYADKQCQTFEEETRRIKALAREAAAEEARLIVRSTSKNGGIS